MPPSYDPDTLKDDLAQFYLVVDLVLELLTGHRHKPPRIRLEFLAEGGDEPLDRRDPTFPTLIIDLKRNIDGKPADFISDLDRKVAEHVMSNRRPNKLAWYVQEPDPRRGERNPRAYWSQAARTVGSFPIEAAFRHTRPQYESSRSRRN